jgi:hypothetical protein
MKRLFLVLAFFLFGVIAVAETPVQKFAGGLNLDKFEVKGLRVSDALEALAKRSQAADPNGVGLNIIHKGNVARLPGVLDPPKGARIPEVPGDPKPMRVNLSLSGVSVKEALEALAKQTHSNLRWDAQAVVVHEPPVGARRARRPEARPALRVEAGVKRSVLRELDNLPSIGRVTFRENTFREVCEVLLDKQTELKKKGGGAVSLILQLDEIEAGRRVSFTVDQLSLLEVLRYAAELANHQVIVDRMGIVVKTRTGGE